MKEFMMIFRSDYNPDFKPSPEQMQASIKKWQDWIGGIASQGKFVSTNALHTNGKTLHANGVVTDGPYAEIKEIVGGYLIAKTDTIEDATLLAEGCPVLEQGGTVEVRDVMEL
ncbi:MAG TPA: transcription initiation protein [Bacteroidetes bacterium]|nr:transcription initiation protein [Bacteroidota bacterium]